MYRREYIVLFVMFNGDVIMAITGVSIIIRKPLDISDIILAILVLSIVYCSVKKNVCKEEERIE